MDEMMLGAASLQYFSAFGAIVLEFVCFIAVIAVAEPVGPSSAVQSCHRSALKEPPECLPPRVRRTIGRR